MNRETDALRYRRHAEDALKHAESCTKVLEKETWRKVAEEWLKLAIGTERPARLR